MIERRIVQMDGKLYEIDMTALRKFERMEMEIMPMPITPTPLDIAFRSFMDYAPILPKRAFLTMPEWEFFYLFPLGKRAFKRT